MNKANNTSTNRLARIPHCRLLWLVLAILLPSAAVAGVGWLSISRPASGSHDKKSGLIATGSVYKVVVHKTSMMPKAGIAVIGAGKIPLPLPYVAVGTYDDREIKTVEARINDPSLVEIVDRQGNVIRLRGKAPGSTKLYVKARSKIGIPHTAEATVGSVVPDGVQLSPQCDDHRGLQRRPLLAAADRELTVGEELLFEKNLILSDTYPPIEPGGFTLVPRKDGKDLWKAEDLLDTNYVAFKAPATAMMTSLKVPAYGLELPVQVYESSAVSEIRLDVADKMSWMSSQYARFEFLVGGEIPCIRPYIPLDLTIGPASVCSLEQNYKGTRTASDDMVYEIPSHFKLVQLSSRATGTCTLKVEIRGTGKSATKQIAVKNR